MWVIRVFGILYAVALSIYKVALSIIQNVISVAALVFPPSGKFINSEVISSFAYRPYH